MFPFSDFSFLAGGCTAGMLDAEDQKPKSLLRTPLFYSSFVILFVALYVGWILFSRWEANREIERRAAEKRREENRRAVEMMGGNRFEILSFYASAGEIRRGETVTLCYGVANAKKVTLEPQSNPVWPSYARCVDVEPTNDTTYTLTAEDAAGHVKTQTLTVKVR